VADDAEFDRKLDALYDKILKAASGRIAVSPISGAVGPASALSQQQHHHHRGGVAIPPLRDRPDPPHYIDRSDLWAALDAQFAAGQRVAVLRGVGGSGKTFAATKFAFQHVRAGEAVGWLRADSPETVLDEYRRYAEWALELHLAAAVGPNARSLQGSLYGLTLEQLLILTVDGAARRSASLLVMDNVEDYAHVRSVVNAHAALGTRFVITTRHRLVDHELPDGKPLDSVTVEIPDADSCVRYLREVCGTRQLSEDDARAVVATCNRLPLRLATAGDFLELYTLISVAEYLSKVEDIRKRREKFARKRDDQIYREVSLSIDTLAKKSPPGHSMLMILAGVNPDAIVLDYVFSWCSEQNRFLSNVGLQPKLPLTKVEFAKAVRACTDLNLLSSVGGPAIVSIHRCIQADVGERVESSKTLSSACKKFTTHYTKQISSLDNFFRGLAEGKVALVNTHLANLTTLDVSAVAKAQET
ncbi:hypothetical protein HK405_012508, partial [Cladochytrium tenue]